MSQIVISQDVSNCDTIRYHELAMILRYRTISQIVISQTSYDFEISIFRFCNILTIVFYDNTNLIL